MTDAISLAVDLEWVLEGGEHTLEQLLSSDDPTALVELVQRRIQLGWAIEELDRIYNERMDRMSPTELKAHTERVRAAGERDLAHAEALRAFAEMRRTKSA
jgi:hypothetical protein